MNEFLSFFGVIALWLAVSYLLWWVFQRRKGIGERHHLTLAKQAEVKVGDAQAVFDDIRSTALQDVSGPNRTQATHALLKRIQERGRFFDDVNALRPRITRALGEECAPLAEVLHIRRDLWAASEIVLIEDARALGPQFAEGGDYDELREEALRLLFRDRANASGEDLIDLRLAFARDEAGKFVADVEKAMQLLREQERLPTASEIIAYPIAAARALPGQIRSARNQLVAFRAQVQALASAIQNSETMVQGLAGLTRAREELPQRVVAGLDKASRAACQSAASVKGHYDFLTAAYDLQAKYEEVLRRTPVLTERGIQFIARLELAEKSEQLKLTSATLRDAAKRLLVRGLAHMIAALQQAQSALERQLAEKTGAGPARRSPAIASAGLESDTRLLTPDAAAVRPHWPVPPDPEPEQPPLAAAKPVEAPKPAAVLDGIRTAGFDTVLAWYKPAVDAVAAKAVPEEPKLSAPIFPPGMERRPATIDTPALERAEPKRSWWRWLIGAGGKSKQPIINAPVPMPPQMTDASAHAPDRLTPISSHGEALPASMAAGTSAKPKLSLASKLTGAATVDLDDNGKENADEPELITEAEDDDPGELTRSILESQKAQDEKPGRGRASRWLRR
jgi:hypothetical protein